MKTDHTNAERQRRFRERRDAKIRAMETALRNAGPSEDEKLRNAKAEGQVIRVRGLRGVKAEQQLLIRIIDYLLPDDTEARDALVQSRYFQQALVEVDKIRARYEEEDADETEDVT